MNKVKAKLSISLVTHNAERYLPFCLKSLNDQTWQEFFLLVIDNGSNDGTARFLKEEYPQIKLVEHPQNIGFAKAHNQGIAWTDSEYIMLLNQDVILANDYLEKAMKYLDENTDVSALTGKILSWNFEDNLKTKKIDSLGLKVFKSHQVADICQGQEDDGSFDEVAEVFGVSGTLPIYRRFDLEKIKISLYHLEYFDEVFFSYKEDVDLAFRMRLAGLKSVYFPQSLAYHNRTVSGVLDKTNKAIKKSRQDRDKMIKKYSYKNHLLMLIKNEFFVNFLKFFFSILWYELKKFIFIILFEQSTLRGLKLFFQQKSKVLKKRRYIIKNIRTVRARDIAEWYY